MKVTFAKFVLLLMPSVMVDTGNNILCGISVELTKIEPFHIFFEGV
jgi:hypothetical protein